MPAPNFAFHLDTEVLKDLVLLARHASRISDIVGAAAEVPTTASFDETIKQVAKKIKMPEPDVGRLLQTIHNIIRTQASMRVDTHQFLELVTSDLKEHEGESDGAEELKTWQQATGAIQEAIGKMGPDHPFYVSRKAERLASARQNVLYDVKVITDLRPVFNKAGDQILRSIITYSLLIDYSDGTFPHRIEFALDASDVSELRKACERAELKVVTIRQSLKEVPWVASLGPDDGGK